MEETYVQKYIEFYMCRIISELICQNIALRKDLKQKSDIITCLKAISISLTDQIHPLKLLIDKLE